MHAFLRFLQHAIAVAVFAVVPAGVSAQVALPVPSSNAAPFLGPGVRVEGLFYTAPVTVDGVTVFRIAARSSDTAAEPITVRLEFIDSAIEQVLATRENGSTVYDPHALRVETRSESNQSYVVAGDPGKPEIPILTITEADAQYNRLPVSDLAEQWRQQLQAALTAALQRRQPAQLKRNYTVVTRLASALVVVTALLWLLAAVLGRRAVRLEERAQKHQATLEREGRNAPAAAGAADRRRRFLALALRVSGPAERARQLRGVAWLIAWLLAVAWFGGAIWALLLFPQTAAAGVAVLQIAGRIIAIWLGVAILNKLGDLIISRIATAYGRTLATSEDRARQLLRAPTISRALGGFKGFILIFVATLTTLSIVGIPVGSVITIGGVLALAVSFAAQNLVRDFLNGFLVLIEDQYVVGDYVMIGDYNGIVEALSLRIVQIRDGRGNLVTIPHSSANQVVNASRDWSRVDYRVAVDPAADVAGAVAALREAMVTLAADGAWKNEVLDAVETIGVETLSKNGIVLRASMRTAPLRQFELYRTLNERVLAAFTAAGIAFGADPLPPLPMPPHASPDPT